MKPLDPRLLPHLTPARVPLAGVVAASTTSGLLLVAQAFAVAGLVTALFEGASGNGWDEAVDAGVLLGLVTVGRALTSWLVDVLSARASATVTTALRHRLLTAALALGPSGLSRRRSGVVALLDSDADGDAGSLSIVTADQAEAAVTALGKAVAALGEAQAVVGKGQNQFSFAISLASTQLTNLAASESRIRDADLAAEAANLTKAQVLQQAGIAAMAQANAAPQAVLSLLQG